MDDIIKELILDGEITTGTIYEGQLINNLDDFLLAELRAGLLFEMKSDVLKPIYLVVLPLAIGSLVVFDQVITELPIIGIQIDADNGSELGRTILYRYPIIKLVSLDDVFNKDYNYSGYSRTIELENHFNCFISIGNDTPLIDSNGQYELLEVENVSPGYNVELLNQNPVIPPIINNDVKFAVQMDQEYLVSFTTPVSKNYISSDLKIINEDTGDRRYRYMELINGIKPQLQTKLNMKFRSLEGMLEEIRETIRLMKFETDELRYPVLKAAIVNDYTFMKYGIISRVDPSNAIIENVIQNILFSYNLTEITNKCINLIEGMSSDNKMWYYDHENKVLQEIDKFQREIVKANLRRYLRIIRQIDLNNYQLGNELLDDLRLPISGKIKMQSKRTTESEDGFIENLLSFDLATNLNIALITNFLLGNTWASQYQSDYVEAIRHIIMWRGLMPNTYML